MSLAVTIDNNEVFENKFWNIDSKLFFSLCKLLLKIKYVNDGMEWNVIGTLPHAVLLPNYHRDTEKVPFMRELSFF